MARHRRHARPMSAHDRARRIRGAAYAGAEAVAFLVAVLVVIFAASLVDPSAL